MSQTQDIHIAYLYPHSTFRGELRSDTLWGIICWGIRFLYGQEQLQTLLAEYGEGKFPFIISSAFPFYEEEKGKQKLFFPRPYLPQKDAKNLAPLSRKEAIPKMKERKEIKDISYISEETLKALCAGLNSDQMQEKLKEKKFVPTIKTDASTHNTLNRLTNGTLEKDGQGQLFHTDEKHVSVPKKEEDNKERKYRSGLFFLIRSENHWDKIQAVLRWLAHTGIGGDKNIGKGFFDMETSEWEAPTPTNAVKPNACMSLSLFMPTDDEISCLNEKIRLVKEKKEPDFLNYQITFRKGFMGNGYPKSIEKKNLAAFVEGSVFPKREHEPCWAGGIKIAREKGGLIDYPLYQNGCAFMIPITINL